MKTRKKQFSAYTQVTKVADIADVKAGIQELRTYFRKQDKLAKAYSKKSLIRLARLQKKLKQMQKEAKNVLTMISAEGTKFTVKILRTLKDRFEVQPIKGSLPFRFVHKSGKAFGFNAKVIA